jgi:hypothetical protein
MIDFPPVRRIVRPTILLEVDLISAKVAVTVSFQKDLQKALLVAIRNRNRRRVDVPMPTPVKH